MTNPETKPQTPPPARPSVAPAPAPAKWRWNPPLWAWIFIIAAVGSSSYVWYQQRLRSAENAAQINDLKRQLRALDENPVMIELKQRVLDQDERLAAALGEQQAKITALQQAFEVTRDVINRDQRGWIMA